MRRLLLTAAAFVLTAAAASAAPRGDFTPDRTFPSARPWTAVPSNDGGALRFAVIGDRTGVARPGVFPQAMTQIGWLQPDFIINVGDLIEGYTDDRAELNRQWDLVEGFIGRSKRPFVFAPGNHDMGSETLVDVWSQRHGAPYYAFTFKNALFLVLDTEDPPVPMSETMARQFHGIVDLMRKSPDVADKMMADYYSGAVTAPPRPGPEAAAQARVERLANFSDPQVDFVRRTLAAHADVKWTFVFFHKPAWKMDSANWAKIEAALGARPYTVFAGHLHYFTHDVRNGHDYFDMATTGAIQHKPGPGMMDHAMFVTLTDQGPSYANVRLNGLADVDNATGQTRAH